MVRKEGAANSHRDFCVRRGVVLHALQWLLTNNRYYLNVCINLDALALLPEDGNLTGLRSVTLDSTIDNPEPLFAQDEDPYDAHLTTSFVPSTAQQMTEQEIVRQSVQERQPHQQQVAPLRCHGLPAVQHPSMSSTQRVTFPVPSPHCSQLVLPILLLHDHLLSLSGTTSNTF